MSLLRSRVVSRMRTRSDSNARLLRARSFCKDTVDPVEPRHCAPWPGGPPADDYLKRILTSRVYEAAVETPLQKAKGLSALLGNDIYLKREDLQPVFSFKLRGAYNRIAQLTEEEAGAGIVACSAGNHAQGVAFAANKFSIDAKIVMPLPTPQIKVDGVREQGGKWAHVILHGDNYDEAYAEAARLVQQEQRTLIHPFDDPATIAGQGTIGLEIVKQMTGQPVDGIFCCVGGGGLLAGVAAYVKRVRPEIAIIGVEAADSAAMTESLLAGRRVTLSDVGLFADGAAVKQVGAETFRLAQNLVDEMILVSTDQICAAIKQAFLETRTIMEPAGALGLAGCVKHILSTGKKGCTFICITSGANMNFDRLRFVAENSDQSETLMSVEIPERPGAFLELYSLIHPRNVTEFSYRYQPGKSASIIMSFQAGGESDVGDVVEALMARGFDALDLSKNEMARTHARYLAGGRAQVENEKLLRFEFPEKPGALRRFLESLGESYNVSLFHYRNQGSDVGRVLAGIQVPPEEEESFESFLAALNYKYVDETENKVYQQFLIQ